MGYNYQKMTKFIAYGVPMYRSYHLLEESSHYLLPQMPDQVYTIRLWVELSNSSCFCPYLNTNPVVSHILCTVKPSRSAKQGEHIKAHQQGLFCNDGEKNTYGQRLTKVSTAMTRMTIVGRLVVN